MRPAVAVILQNLLDRDESALSLDTIGDAIGTAAITPDEIEELFSALEAAGRQVEKATPNVREHLGVVLREARRLKQELKTAPTVESIAASTGLDESAVRAALLYASVMGR
jgi:hypothetical protein